MSDTHREQNICQAIRIIAENQVINAGYDMTKTGVIAKIIDADKGEYQIKYGANSDLLTVYSNGNVSYQVGEQVLFLIPENNINSHKIILDRIGRNNNGGSAVFNNITITEGRIYPTQIKINDSETQNLQDYIKSLIDLDSIKGQIRELVEEYVEEYLE